MARITPCPSCGAAATPAALRAGACSYCGTALTAHTNTNAGPSAASLIELGRTAERTASRAVGFAVLGVVVTAGVGVAIFLMSAPRSAPPTFPVTLNAPIATPAVGVALPENLAVPVPPPAEPVVAPPPPQPPPTEAPPAAEPAPEPEPPPDDPKTFPTSKWQPLKGCLCRTDIDGLPGDETVQLAVVPLGSGTEITSAGVRKETRLAFAVLAGSAPPAVLDVTAETAPPSLLVGTRMAIGVVCSSGKLVVASQSSATAWALPGSAQEAWSLAWTTPLDATFPRPPPSEDGISITCTKLSVSRGVVSVAREGDSPLPIAISDGHVPTR